MLKKFQYLDINLQMKVFSNMFKNNQIENLML